MRKTAIVGAGMIRFGKFPDRYIEDMGAEAALNALRHAGMGHKEVEAAFIGNVRNPPNAGQRILDEIGLSGIPTWNHENACGSSSAAFRDGYAAVASGLYDKVLVIGVEQMTRLGKGLLQFEDGSSLELDMGLVTPAMFSLMGMRHMEEFGTKPEQFAQISVKNHKQGAMNPYAQYQNELTLEEVLNSRMICDPITLLQCTPIGDGASAVVLTAGKIAKRYTNKPVEVKASVFTGGRYKGEGGAVGIESCVRASREAYEASGIGPEDLDVIELHDCFTVHELVAYEDLGLCPKGEGGRLVDEGATALGGKIPVNPSGGLLSKGHPLGATGVGQIVELVWQLRGECGKRQVRGAKVALAHNGGGMGPGIEPAMMSITILTQ
jgi:benzoylsuccinyl-CoA thiolase BbsB subunit